MGLSLGRAGAGGIRGRRAEHDWAGGLLVTTVPAQQTDRCGFQSESRGLSQPRTVPAQRTDPCGFRLESHGLSLPGLVQVPGHVNVEREREREQEQGQVQGHEQEQVLVEELVPQME